MIQTPHIQPTEFVCDTVPSMTSFNLFRHDGSLRSLDEIEREVICLHIGHHDGQMSAVARSLGIGRSTLYRKLRQFEREGRALNTRVG